MAEPTSDPFEGFDRLPFTAEGRTYPTFRIGSGPGIVVMTEMPGISPKVAGFGRRLADEGFTAVLPSLFGTPGREPSIGYGVQSMIPACVAKEFAALATDKTSAGDAVAACAGEAGARASAAAPESAPSACASPAASRSG